MIILQKPLRESLVMICLFKVCFHIEPYKGRDEVNMYTNVKYIIEKWVLFFLRHVNPMIL